MFELWPRIGRRDIGEKGTPLLEQRALNYWPIGTPHTQMVSKALCALVVMFELCPRIGSRDTDGKLTTLKQESALTY
jgi:hypothetical protein